VQVTGECDSVVFQTEHSIRRISIARDGNL